MANSNPQASALAAFNAAPAGIAEREILACCASRTFARAIASARPYREPAQLRDTVDAEFIALSWDDIVESMDAHPRIGDRAAALQGWSAAEQSGAAAASDRVRRGLAEGNAAYEARFGHIFLICASSLSGHQILDQLQVRLTHDEQAERPVVREELRKITQLRIDRLLTT